MVPMDTQYPIEGTRAAQLLALIEAHPGQTQWWLMLRSGGGANGVEKALRGLQKYDRIEFAEDDRGRKRYRVKAA